jgi:hypothetical protein
MPRGFRLSVDLSSFATLLTCLSCRGSHQLDDEHDVVLAATMATFLASHQRCEQPVVA